MKICICVNHFYPLIGGCEVVTKQIADFVSQNHDVHVVTRRVKNRNHSELSYPVVEYSPGSRESFHKILQSIKPDLIFIYSDVFDFTQFVITNCTCKIIISLCGANWIHKNPLFGGIFLKHCHKISSIIVHSQEDRDYEFCCKNNLKHKLAIVPNGVDLSEFDDNQLSRSDLLPELSEQKWILNVSNFFPGKGQLLLLDVLNTLDCNDFVYIQISSDIDFKIGKELENAWIKKSIKMKYKTKLIKNPPRSHVIGFLKQSDIFAFSSEKEVAPLCILESMAAQLPWVSCDVGNIRELRGGKIINTTKNYQYNSMFSNTVRRDFSDYIQKILKTPSKCLDGRRQVEEKFVWNKILPQYLNIINNA